MYDKTETIKLIELMKRISAIDYFKACNVLSLVDILNTYDNGDIPDSIPKNILSDSYYTRDMIIKACGFSVISMDWIRILSKYLYGLRGLEIMAGKGALSKALQDCGISVICTDSYSWESDNDYSDWRSHFTEIEQISAMDAVIKYGADIDFIICSWSCGSSFVEALDKLHEINPNCEIIYIGENESGCTADDMFFDTYNILPFTDVNEIYPQFQHIHDLVYYAIRKK